MSIAAMATGYRASEPVPGHEGLVFGPGCELQEPEDPDDPNGPGDPNGEGPITGTVTSGEGVPIAEVGVIAYSATTGLAVGSVHTSSDGSYILPDPGGPVRIGFHPQMAEDPMVRGLPSPGSTPVLTVSHGP
jgi:hypothetical protein